MQATPNPLTTVRDSLRFADATLALASHISATLRTTHERPWRFTTR